jgi:hypothetical protein
MIASLLTASCSALPTLQTPASTGSAEASASPIATSAATPAPTEPFVPPAGWPPAPFTLAWTRAEVPPPDFVGFGLAGTSRGFVAVGHSRSGPPFTGQVYISRDGSHWRLVADGDVFGAVSLNAVDEAQPTKTVIVAGTIVHPGGASVQSGIAEGIAWVSVDLEHWLPASTSTALVGADMRWVAAFGDAGFEAYGGYASGETLLRCPWGCIDGVGVWRSLDGRAWERIFTEDDHGFVLTVVTSSLLFGGNLGIGVPAIWRARPSGWQRTDSPPGLAGIPTAVWSTGACAEVLAVSAGSAMFVSEDQGQTWRTALGTKPELRGVIRLGMGYLGWNDGAGGLDRGLWTSSDGFNWGPIDYFGRVDGTFGVSAIAQMGARLVAFGSADDPGPFVATVPEYSEPPCLE